MEEKAAHTAHKEELERRNLESRERSMGTWIFQTHKNPSRRQETRGNVGTLLGDHP